MSFPYTPNLHDAKIESLHTQQDYLNLLRLRHLQWMNSAADKDLEQMHLEIAGLLEQVAGRYNDLLDKAPSAPIGAPPPNPSRKNK